MAVRSASAQWNGQLRDGNGRMRMGTGAWEGPYSFSSRFEEGQGTNPEELIAAAHAGCFSMALSGELGKAGHDPKRVTTTAKVHLNKSDAGFSITRIHLESEADVPGLDDAEFQKIAEGASKGCPVSRALQAVEITLHAKLAG
ncbi:MAG TPA: OsmC family protein [Longimicrobiales bacterium]|nr:OsmC family protein [Longimicrobiales bacterium]